jgi:hypothetical protein
MFKGGYNLSDIAAVTNNRDNDGMFGDNGWWIILLFLFAGWGRGFGGEGMAPPYATQADVRAAVDQQTLISKLDQQTYGLADSTYALNSTMTNGFHGVDSAICTLGYNLQGGLNSLSHQLSDCCCENGRAIERGFAEVNYNLASQSCDTRRTIVDSARDIIENNNAGVRSILDFLTQDKIATLQAENQSLKFAASQANQNTFIVANQEAQTAELIRRLATPTPVPAYMVPNPNCCYGNVGVTYGNNCCCSSF